MINDISRLIAFPPFNLHDLLRRINAGGAGILLVTDGGGRLVRTLTDGDLRRLLLQGISLDKQFTDLPSNPPVTAQVGTDDNTLLALMKKWGVNHIPLIDVEGFPRALALIRDLEQPILLSSPHMGEHELDFVGQAFDTNWIAPLGPNVDGFETELARHVGSGHAAAVSSGTAAIHLALDLLGVGPGDTVFCSTFTFVASANPILYLGAKPVFIDSEPTSWNMSVPALERALAVADQRRQLPAAVIVVNLYGQSADMAPIVAACNRYGVPVVEDAAESLGATYRGKSSGTLGKIGIFSFNGNKIITTSGGGMLVSDDGDLIEKARFLATQGRDPAPWYQHSRMAYNYRMSNILAGVGRGQLRVLADRVQARRRNFEIYQRSLADIQGLGWMPEAAYGSSTRWLSVCTLDPELASVSPSKLINELAKHHIEARHVWKPMHLQPLFAACEYYPHEQDWSFSERAFDTGICLPSGSNLADEQIRRVCSTICEILRPHCPDA